MASRKEWCLPVRKETARFGLLLLENEVENSSQTCTLIHLTSLVLFIPCQQTIAWRTPLIPYGMAYGQEETARFGLLLVENEVKNNSQT